MTLGRWEIAICDSLPQQFNTAAGLQLDGPAQLWKKRLLGPAKRLVGTLLVDGFIERNIGRWIRQDFKSGQTFLDVGCGDMRMRRFVPRDEWYNALDLRLTEYNCRRVLGSRRLVNLAIASATSVPLPDNCADLIVSTQCLYQIPDVDAAVREIRRVARSGAKFLCSVPNGYSDKYRHGHRGCAHSWNFDGFRKYMEGFGFRHLESWLRGWWPGIPLPGLRTIHLPLTLRREESNTDIFYRSEVVK